MKLHEIQRTYFFPSTRNEGWETVHVHKVVKVKVSNSGGHRLTKSNGKMIYIPSGWLCMEIDSNHGWEI